MFILIRKSTGEYLASSKALIKPVINRKDTDPIPEIEWIEWNKTLPENIDTITPPIIKDGVLYDEEGNEIPLPEVENEEIFSMD